MAYLLLKPNSPAVASVNPDTYPDTSEGCAGLQSLRNAWICAVANMLPLLYFKHQRVMLQGFVESIGSFGVFAACYNC